MVKSGEIGNARTLASRAKMAVRFGARAGSPAGHLRHGEDQTALCAQLVMVVRADKDQGEHDDARSVEKTRSRVSRGRG